MKHSADIEGRIPITQQHRVMLRKEKHRTQCGSITLLKSAQSVPEGLSGATIDNWISGRSKTVRREYLEFVLHTYKALPDGMGGPNKPIKGAKSRVRITDDMHPKLAQLHASAPANYLQHAPADLNPVNMAHILSGRNKSVSQEAWAFLLEIINNPPNLSNPMPAPDYLPETIEPPRIRQQPTNKIRKSVGGVEYIEITDQRYDLLHCEVRRTLVSPRHLLKNSSDVPSGFDAATAMGWYFGKLRAAERRFWDYLLERYSELPDRNS